MTEKIVVGVDGSEASTRALQWAAQEAAARDAKLVVVHAWHFPAGAYVPYVPAAALTFGMMEEAGDKVIADALSSISIADGVRIDTTVVEGAPATALLHEAQDADLLVVGSRGHGAVTGMFLGSVSQACAHHAPCPVVIISAHCATSHLGGEPLVGSASQ